MTTWTYSKDGVQAVVTADTVTLAAELVSQKINKPIEVTDLIPLPTHHRYVRIL